MIKPVVGEEEIKAVREVLESGLLTEGEWTRKFERMVADYVGAKYAVAFSNCTATLESCLKVLGVGAGDEVLVPDFTHPATALAVLNVGAEPVLADVDLDTYNISYFHLKEFVKAVIPVSWGGYPLNLPLIEPLKDLYGYTIIEDGACSLGSSIYGLKTGSVADLTCFSFHPRKIITTGEGGMVTTDNDEWAEQLRCFKQFGVKDGSFVQDGTNYKMSNIQGAIGVEQMKKIDRIIERRIELAHTYDELFENFELVKMPFVEKDVKHVYQTYAIYLKKEGMRDKLIAELNKKGIETQIGTYALHHQPRFSNLQRRGTLENSAKLYRNLLALPMSHDMTYQDQIRVAKEVKDLLK